LSGRDQLYRELAKQQSLAAGAAQAAAPSAPRTAAIE
jgi:hypothetical protein